MFVSNEPHNHYRTAVRLTPSWDHLDPQVVQERRKEGAQSHRVRAIGRQRGAEYREDQRQPVQGD
jgi:hypothetical protein